MPSKPRVLVTRRLMPAVEQRLVQEFDAELNATDRMIPPAELLTLAEGRDAILPGPADALDATFIKAMPPSVRIIANHAVGTDNIDLAAARARGITVTNTPDVLSAATAEIALLLMLAAARRAGEAERLVRRGDWRSFSIDFMCGTEMTGKSLGIIGMGRIGRLVARRAKAFDMTVHYHNRSRLAPELEDGATFHGTVEDLLPQAQFLVITCPLTPETRKLMNARTLALLPRGAVLVNVARGPIVDDAALIPALRSGQLAAAGLDVYDGEPRIDPGYHTLENVVLLPHIGSSTTETRTAMGMKALDNLAAFFAGAEPPDRVA